MGLGAGAAPGAGLTSRGAPASRGPLLEEELKAEANQLLSITRGGDRGTPARLQARPCRKGNESTDSRLHGGKRTPSTGPAPGAACNLGVHKANGCAEEGEDCFSEGSTALAEGVLKSQRQEGKQQ